MAIRLAKVFGSTPETWVRMQTVYDLAVALKSENKIRVTPYEPRSRVQGWSGDPGLSGQGVARCLFPSAD